MANGEKQLINSIKVKQDVGGPYPRYKRVTLHLWSDGSVTWDLLESENGVGKYELDARPEGADND